VCGSAIALKSSSRLNPLLQPVLCGATGLFVCQKIEVFDTPRGAQRFIQGALKFVKKKERAGEGRRGEEVKR
jgi:hypothetical protein